MTDRNLTDLCPELQIIAREWLAQCKNQGLNVSIIVTYRSAIDQNTAKAQGLSNAAAGESPHNCCNSDGTPGSKAFDFGIFEADGSYVTNGTDERYSHAAEIGKSLCLVWGGDWVTFKDLYHLELADWKTD